MLLCPEKKTFEEVATSEESQHCETNSSIVAEKECSVKRVKILYNLEKEVEQLINTDDINKKYWDDCKKLLEEGKNVGIIYLNIL